MTEQQEAAKKWAELLLAFAEGKTIQWADAGHWYECEYVRQIDTNSNVSCYRIKPETKIGKYRVALHKDYEGVAYTTTVSTDEIVNESHPTFIKWLTDWVEYEILQTEKEWLDSLVGRGFWEQKIKELLCI